jgi:hypothetical protein
MITITCPWCDVEQAAQLIGQDHDDAAFCCHECGTTVLWQDDEERRLDMAA